MKITAFSLLLVALVRSAGCDTDSPAPAAVTDCGPLIQVRDPMPRLTSDDYQVLAASAEGMCLSVTIAATGCSSAGWTVSLHTAGDVAESSPTRSNALLVFDDGVGENEMTCQAIIEETYRFDLSPYLAATGSSVLTLTGRDVTVAINEP